MAEVTPKPRMRLLPCRVLNTFGIPCVLWFEDAAGCYGVPTVVFDLYLLVPDIDVAAEVLSRSGWTMTSERQGLVGAVDADSPQHRLNPPPQDLKAGGSGSKPTTTVLLAARDWNFNFEDLPRDIMDVSKPTFVVPPLPRLVDALIDSFIDVSPKNDGLLLFLAYHLGYLYGHVPELKERAFAEKLMYEHRQYHLDVLYGMRAGTLPFRAHQHKVRDELRRGLRELQDCSISPDDEPLIPEELDAYVAASMRDPFANTEEVEEQKNEKNAKVVNGSEMLR